MSIQDPERQRLENELNSDQRYKTGLQIGASQYARELMQVLRHTPKPYEDTPGQIRNWVRSRVGGLLAEVEGLRRQVVPLQERDLKDLLDEISRRQDDLESRLQEAREWAEMSDS